MAEITLKDTSRVKIQSALLDHGELHIYMNDYQKFLVTNWISRFDKKGFIKTLAFVFISLLSIFNIHVRKVINVYTNLTVMHDFRVSIFKKDSGIELSLLRK